MRVIIAGIVGGIVLFFWGAVAHMFLPTGDMGIKSMPNDAAVMSALKSNISEPGMYFYPGMENHHHASEAEQAAFDAKYKSGPHGLLIYYPIGTELMPPSMLLTELASNILGALLVAFVMSLMSAGFILRVLASGLIGVVAWLSVDASYWNWYGFPTDYFLAQIVDQGAGWLIAGVPIAFLVKGRG